MTRIYIYSHTTIKGEYLINDEDSDDSEEEVA